VRLCHCNFVEMLSLLVVTEFFMSITNFCLDVKVIFTLLTLQVFSKGLLETLTLKISISHYFIDITHLIHIPILLCLLNIVNSLFVLLFFHLDKSHTFQGYEIIFIDLNLSLTLFFGSELPIPTQRQ